MIFFRFEKLGQLRGLLGQSRGSVLSSDDANSFFSISYYFLKNRLKSKIETAFDFLVDRYRMTNFKVAF